MTVLVEHRLRRPLRLRRLVGAVAIGITLAALAGVWAGRLLSPSGDSKAPVSRVLEAGPAHLVLPAAWQLVAPAERFRGLESEQLAVLSPTSDLSTMVVATFGTADQRSLIPRALGELVHGPRSQPRVASLAGRPAWVYRGLETSWNMVMDVTVLPTTAGMLALACVSRASSMDAGPGCASSVKSVSLRGVTALEPSASVALAVQLPSMLARLDDARVDGRAALSRARTREAQAAALHRLAAQHVAAADRLRTAFGTPARPLVGGLEDTGRAYTALGTAASDGSSARFGVARLEVRRAETELGASIDRTREAGMRDTAAAKPTSPRPKLTDPAPPFLTQPMFVIVLLLGSCVAGFAVSGPLADALAKVRRA